MLYGPMRETKGVRVLALALNVAGRKLRLPSDVTFVFKQRFTEETVDDHKWIPGCTTLTFKDLPRKQTAPPEEDL